MTDCDTRDENLQTVYHLRLPVPSLFPSKVPVEGPGLPDIWFGCGVLVCKKRVVIHRMSVSLFKNVSESRCLESFYAMAIVAISTMRSCQCTYCLESLEPQHERATMGRSMLGWVTVKKEHDKKIHTRWMRDKLHWLGLFFFQLLIILLDKCLKVTIFTWLKIKPFIS